MARTVIQACALPAAPDRLCDMYLDAEQHAKFTGGAVRVEPRAGASFSAFNGVLSGKIIEVQPKRLIAQTWRSANWRADAIDSVLILTFWPEPAGGRVELVHVNVPDEDFAGVSEGWHTFYWQPWRAYLKLNP